MLPLPVPRMPALVTCEQPISAGWPVMVEYVVLRVGDACVVEYVHWASGAKEPFLERRGFWSSSRSGDFLT